MTKIRNTEEQIDLIKINGEIEIEVDDIFFKAKGQANEEMFNYKDVTIFRKGGIDKFYNSKTTRERMVEGEKAAKVEGLE